MFNRFRRCLCVLLSATTFSWGIPVQVFAQDSAGPTVEALAANPVEAVSVRLGSDRYLRGVAKTAEGKPAADVPVVLGVNGRVVGRVIADKEGKFAVGPLKPGKYQVATRDAVAMLAVHAPESAPQDSADTIEVSRPAMVARGQTPGMLTNPWFIGLVVAAAIAIPLAIVLADDDDDDDAS
jgi:hypothetical protein